MLKEEKANISSDKIINLLNYHFADLMKEFYEMQSSFLSTRYKLYKSLETSNIIICFVRSSHLAIIRQRETNLDYDVSLNNFFDNLNNIRNYEGCSHKIVSIVKITGIPKETVRRKLKKLIQREFVRTTKNKQYYWIITSKRRDAFVHIMKNDIKAISKFISVVTKHLSLNLTQKMIESEIESQFSFYFYHFLSCQLTWLKMWQTKVKDIDLIFIAMQVLIPTLKYFDKNFSMKNIGLDNLHTLIGKTNTRYNLSSGAISASSISEISGIPRATCIRKLEKLVKLGLLIREVKTKRYYVNQQTSDRTKNIIKKEHIQFTVESFGNFLSVVIRALLRLEK